MDFSTAYDLFTNCFIYGSIAYLSTSLLVHLFLCLIALIDESEDTEPDFYYQVKELLNPSTETVLELHANPSLDHMTLRQLRTYIKDNELQQQVRNCLGKTVSNARKFELVKALS